MPHYYDEIKHGVECNRLEKRQHCFGIAFVHSDFGDWELYLWICAWLWEIKIGKFWKARK